MESRKNPKILCVAGARPNFMKVGPILRVLRDRARFVAKLVHTGQHYDARLSKVFFDDLNIPRPDFELAVGSASHAMQTAEIMRRFESVLRDEQPEAVLVVGDVNSTIACALVAAKFVLDRPFATTLGIRRRPLTIHVEAGLRSFDDDMPEEVNRRLTDAVSDVLFVSDPAGMTNLDREGVPAARCFFVGNVMIDALLAARAEAMESPILETLGLDDRPYALLTLHRPSNVDDLAGLTALLDTLDEIAHRIPIVFPIHPRTRAQLFASGHALDPRRWCVCDPLGYLDFVKLTARASVVLTDSGGVQEETTVLGVPCLTLRDSTERPVTLTEGTNRLTGTDREAILAAFADSHGAHTRRVPRLWDGRAAERIEQTLAEIFHAST
jgi:UDP-N-acetylglucosamine 2-epimerase (non-hydrolysing)